MRTYFHRDTTEMRHIAMWEMHNGMAFFFVAPLLVNKATDYGPNDHLRMLLILVIHIFEKEQKNKRNTPKLVSR